MKSRLFFTVAVLGIVVLVTTPHMANAGVTDYIVGGFLTIFHMILAIWNAIATLLIKFLLYLLVPLLTVHSFITHPFVTQGWPFIQGIANLGFIIAMLFIAIATTLRLDTINVYRVLPRLLLAAILINFSLVISGIIIDASRVLMAIEIRLMAGSTGIVGAEILDGSAILPLANDFTGAIAKNTKVDIDENIKPTVGLLLTLLVKIIFGIGLFTLVAGLFIRYVALLLLLIMSPLAFLASALPNTQGLAKRWWSNFLKYVFYGPVALFVLVLITQVGKLISLDLPPDANGLQLVLQSILSLSITVVMLFMAAKAGSFLGGTGSAATLGMATRYGKSFGRAALGTATYPYRKVGSAIGSSISGSARDFTNSAKTAASDAARNTPYLRRVMPAKRDDKGNLKKGQTSFGSRLGSQFALQGKKKEEAQAAIAAANKRPGGIKNNLTEDALNFAKLRKGHVLTALDKAVPKGVNQLLENSADTQQMLAVAGNADYLRSKSDSDRQAILAAIQKNSNFRGGDQAAILKRFQQTLDNLDKE